MPRLIDGKKIALEIKNELKVKVEELKQQEKDVCLAVIQVGNDAASTVYVNGKKKDCEYIGIKSLSYELPEETTENELLDLIGKLNGDINVHGILVQLPLPSHMNEEMITQAISPEKDVDGFHEMNIGKLCIGENGFLNAVHRRNYPTFKTFGIEIAGKRMSLSVEAIMWETDCTFCCCVKTERLPSLIPTRKI